MSLGSCNTQRKVTVTCTVTAAAWIREGKIDSNVEFHRVIITKASFFALTNMIYLANNTEIV